MCSDIGVCEYSALYNDDIVRSVHFSIRFDKDTQRNNRMETFQRSLIEIYMSIDGWIDEVA